MLKRAEQILYLGLLIDICFLFISWLSIDLMERLINIISCRQGLIMYFKTRLMISHLQSNGLVTSIFSFSIYLRNKIHFLKIVWGFFSAKLQNI